MAEIAFLESGKSGNRVPADVPQIVGPGVAVPLYVRYDMEALKKTARRENPAKYAAASVASVGMWRYRDVLPDVPPVTLGAGWTPMVPSRRLKGLLVKCEGRNPTGSWEVRGMSLAVMMARQYGLRHLALASAGDAAGALAAYCAAAGIAAHVFMPRDVPFANYVESMVYRADIRLVGGSIADCVRLMSEEIERQKADGVAAEDVWFDVAALEPFRVEGEKTMGYELCEQLGWEYPEAVFCPAGAGLIGMWKAFEEMEQLGWVSGRRPKMYVLESRDGVPVGRVPEPFRNTIVCDIVRISGGEVLAVSDEEILASILDYGKEEGLFLSPEGASAMAGYERMIAMGVLRSDDRVVLFDTGAGLRNVDVVAGAMKLRKPGGLPTSMPVGGIITPV